MSFVKIIHDFLFPFFLALLAFFQLHDQTVLQQDRFTLRQVISQYTLNHQRRPRSLDELVNEGYMKSVPNGALFDQSGSWFEDEPEIRDFPIPQGS